MHTIGQHKRLSLACEERIRICLVPAQIKPWIQPQQFVSECSKVAFQISLLSRWALLWARAIRDSQSSFINSFDAFSAHFREFFGQSVSSLSIGDQLIRLHQGTSSVSVYTLQFRTLAAACGWNETALLTTYRKGLDPQIRTQMAIYDDNVGLESFIQKAVKISQWLTTCLPDETAHSQASPAACPPVPEPMQLDSNRLTHTERATHSHRTCTTSRYIFVPILRRIGALPSKVFST